MKEIPVKVRQIDRYKKVQLAVVIEPPSESTSMDAGWSYWWSYGFYTEQELDSIYLYISVSLAENLFYILQNFLMESVAQNHPTSSVVI